MKKSKTQSPIIAFLIKYRVALLLTSIVLLAIFFRFYQLSTLPPGLHPDEAANGLDIVKRIFDGNLQIIYSTNGPRESLFFFFQAIFVGLLGNTILALRIAPALFGVAAVVVVYLYTKDWFGRRTALLAAFLMAVNPWVVTISRDGFRASMVPLMIALVALFAGRAYLTNKKQSTKKTVYFVLAALSFGLGFYTYTAFLMFGLVALAGLIYLFVQRRDWLRENTKNLIIAAATCAIVLTPLAITVALNPANSTARAGGTSVLNSENNGGNAATALVTSTAKTLLQYHYQGDMNNRHNLAGLPLVNTFVGIMLILGLLVAFSRFGRVKYAAVVAMFFAMMLPAILTTEGLPHALRSIGTAASVFTLAAIGIDYLLSKWYKTFPINAPARSVGTITVCLLLLLTAVIGYRQYFVAWAQDPATYQAYNEGMVAIGTFIASQNSGGTYLIAGGYESMPAEYLAHNKKDFTLLSVENLKNLPLATDKQTFVFPASSDSQQIIALLQAKYPTGKLTSHYSDFNNDLLFYSFQVN